MAVSFTAVGCGGCRGLSASAEKYSGLPLYPFLCRFLRRIYAGLAERHLTLLSFLTSVAFAGQRDSACSEFIL